jgi:hypothetical protein
MQHVVALFACGLCGFLMVTGCCACVSIVLCGAGCAVCVYVGLHPVCGVVLPLWRVGLDLTGLFVQLFR